MTLDERLLDPQERAALSLRQLYLQAGYSRFRMDKFEHYDLYARYRDPLVSERVLTFTDAGGRLKALRPDVTLSIIKQYQGEPLRVQYSENVYRPGADGEFREIMQAGIECLGDIGLTETCEVAALAVRSLQALGEDYVLTLSDMGLVQRAITDVTRDPQQQKQLLQLIGRKSLGELKAYCAANGLPAEGLKPFITLSGEPQEVLGRLPGDGTQTLRAVADDLQRQGAAGRVRIDFSIGTDAAYYDGILFKGYLQGRPNSVLSGGRYDPLLRRMGRPGGAVGFAVYLSELEGA